MQLTIAEAATLARQLDQASVQCFIIGIEPDIVMQCASGQHDKPASTGLGEFDLLHHCRYCFAHGLWAQYFPLITAWNASMSTWLWQELLQLRILGLQVFEQLGFRHFHATELGMPGVKECIAKAVFPTRFLD